MPSIRLIPLAVLVASCVSAGSVQAQDAPSKGEQALKYRKSLYQVVAWNFGPMAAMAQGKVPYDAKEFSLRAERVAVVTPMLTEAYPPESEGVANSRLKPGMWSERADFDAKLKALVDRSSVLAMTAKSGDFAQSKAAFFDTAGACKSCHDKYRTD